MDKGRFVIETHLRTGRPIGELAKVYEVDRSWLYRRLAGYRREGESGLEPRSRRPHRSPGRVVDLYEEEIVALRKELSDAGFDAGADTIRSHLARRHAVVPSTSSIWRVLKSRGFVTPQPHKRPKSSYVRFCAELPNECWQADVTHVEVADGVVFEVLNVIDDHSRLCVASRVFVSTRSPDVVRTLHRAAGQWGYPEKFLSDNGAIFTASKGGGVGDMEAELLSLGIASKHGRPYHPQTQDKVERFHQTVKQYLAKQEPGHYQEAAPRPTRPLRHLLQHRATAPGHRPAHPGRIIRCPGQEPSARPEDRCRRLPGAQRQGGQDRVGHLALPRSTAPHRCGADLRRLAGRAAGGRARGPNTRRRRVATTDSWSSTLIRTTSACPELGVYDVARHRCLCRATSQ